MPAMITELNGLDTIVLTRYRDVAGVLRNASTSISNANIGTPSYLGDGPASKFFAASISTNDGEMHQKLRNTVGPVFSPKGVKRLESEVSRIIGSTIDAAADDGDEIEVVSSIAHQIAIKVACFLLHMPQDDAERLLTEHFHDLTSVLEGEVREEDIPRLNDSMTYFAEYFEETLQRGRYLPVDDLVGAIYKSSTSGLSRQESLALLMIVFSGNYHTTMVSLTNTVRMLAEFPQIREELIANTTLSAQTWDEVLRRNPPAHFRTRYAGEDIQIDDHRIPKGSKLLLGLASANWDEHAFPEPEKFDIHRASRAHVSFGGGSHMCLGMQLSRLEGRLFIPKLLERLPRFSKSPTEHGYHEDLSFPQPAGYSIIVG
jgi:cytochrome P450